MAENLSETIIKAVQYASLFAVWRLIPRDTAPDAALGLLEALGEALANANDPLKCCAEDFRGHYPAGPPEFHGLMGASYHEKGWWYAIEVYRRAFNQTPYCLATHEPVRDWASVRDCWPKVTVALWDVPEFDAMRLQDCIRDEAARQTRCGSKAHGATPTENHRGDTVIYIGNGRVRIGEETIVLTEQESAVLEALVDNGALSKDALENNSGYQNAVKVLRRICEKYPPLGAAITLPGKPHSGGYRTTIRRDTRLAQSGPLSDHSRTITTKTRCSSMKTWTPYNS